MLPPEEAEGAAAADKAVAVNRYDPIKIWNSRELSGTTEYVMDGPFWRESLPEGNGAVRNHRDSEFSQLSDDKRHPGDILSVEL